MFVTGLATDFCVAWTAMDARKLGFTTYVIEDATRAIDLSGSLAAAWKKMTEAGVKRIQSSDIAWSGSAQTHTSEERIARLASHRRALAIALAVRTGYSPTLTVRVVRSRKAPDKLVE